MDKIVKGLRFLNLEPFTIYPTLKKNMIKKKAQTGQSTIEYMFLVAAVVVFMLFITSGSSSIFRGNLSNAVSDTIQGMGIMGAKVTEDPAHN